MLVANAEIPDDKLFATACFLPLTLRSGLMDNLRALGVPVTPPDKKKKKLKRKDRDVTLELSRWTPVIKDVMEDLIADTLSTDDFPFVGSVSPPCRPR